jgi:hypothetical protein
VSASWLRLLVICVVSHTAEQILPEALNGCAQSAMVYGCSGRLGDTSGLKGSWVDGKNRQTKNEGGRKKAQIRLTGIQVV